jgi:hypothetical protein
VKSMGRAVFAPVRFRGEEKSQTWGRLPPYPRREDKDRCAGKRDLLGAKPPERRRIRRSRRILLGLWRRIGVLEFIEYEAGSFNYGEYAFAQEGTPPGGGLGSGYFRDELGCSALVKNLVGETRCRDIVPYL